MTTLREAAQQALEAVEQTRRLMPDSYYYERLHKAAAALRAALADGDNAAPTEPDLSRCPRCGGPADNGHDRSIPPSPYFCTKCMEEPEACPHGVTDGTCKECYGEATNSEPVTVYTTLRQREWPALWTGCPNCASLQDQNTELDRKLAELERKPLTDEEIMNIVDKERARVAMNEAKVAYRVARAIERAHGIGEKE